MHYGFHKKLIVIRNVSWAANQNIRRISKGSHGIKNVETFELHSAVMPMKYIFQHILKQNKVMLHNNNILQMYCVSDPIHAALVSKRKHLEYSMYLKIIQYCTKNYELLDSLNLALSNN